VSGLGLGQHALLTQCGQGALVEVERHDHSHALAATGQHGRLVAVAGAAHSVGERVTHVGDAFLVLNLRRVHSRIVTQTLQRLYGLRVHERYDVPVKQGEWHRSCQHKNYRLTCADYETLVAEIGNRCQICGTPGPDTWRRKLVIDHDHKVGQWAVRGLLCPPCNTALTREGPTTDRQATYLTAPWYQRSVRPLTLTEPEHGTRVSDGANGVWKRDGDLWHPMRSYYREPQAWTWLVRMFGPHRITKETT
jgi:hypothetical protein